MMKVVSSNQQWSEISSFSVQSMDDNHRNADNMQKLALNECER